MFMLIMECVRLQAVDNLLSVDSSFKNPICSVLVHKYVDCDQVLRQNLHEKFKRIGIALFPSKTVRYAVHVRRGLPVQRRRLRLRDGRVRLRRRMPHVSVQVRAPSNLPQAQRPRDCTHPRLTR